MGWVTMQVVRVELEPYGGMARLVAVEIRWRWVRREQSREVRPQGP